MGIIKKKSVGWRISCTRSCFSKEISRQVTKTSLEWKMASVVLVLMMNNARVVKVNK